VYNFQENNYEQIKGVVDDYNWSEDESNDDKHNDNDNG
jgi:hypothetical protein